MFHWLWHGFWLVNQFIGSSLVVTTISSYTLKITVTIAHVTTHTKSSNSSGHTAVPFELRNSSQFPFPYSLISSRHGPRTENTVLLLRRAQKTSHVITISPVHWRADCCLATCYKHSSYRYVTLSEKMGLQWNCSNHFSVVFLHRKHILIPYHFSEYRNVSKFLKFWSGLTLFNLFITKCA
jgi:hypothetical protein